jgi:hypothetical protein
MWTQKGVGGELEIPMITVLSPLPSPVVAATSSPPRPDDNPHGKILP